MELSLRPLDEDLMSMLLAVAIADAEPAEVIPPVDGPPGWTEARQEFFRSFHRDRFGGLDAQPLQTVMYAVMLEGAVVGMIRLSRVDPPGTCETGMWLGRSVRGRGIAREALRLVVAEAGAAGAHTVRADTTVANLAEQGNISDHLVRTGGRSWTRYSRRVAPAPYAACGIGGRTLWRS